MRRFAFRFQHLLNLKESLEKVHEAALGEALASLNQERDTLTRLEQARHQGQGAGNQWLKPRLRLSLLGLNAIYLQRLERQIGEQQERLRQAATVVEQRRRKLHEATRERRVFEILREKAWEAYWRAEQRQQGLHLDEVGKQLYLQRIGGELAPQSLGGVDRWRN